MPPLEWSKQSIIKAMLDWNLNHGEQPRSVEWAKSGPTHPTTSTVIRCFGSWNEAIKAAGFETRSGGRKRGGGHVQRPYPRKSRAKATMSDPVPDPKPTSILSRDAALRHGRSSPPRRRSPLIVIDTDDHSTNTPAKNKAMVTRMRAK